MMLDFSIPGKVQINMHKYIKCMVDNLPEDMNGEAGTPAGNNLFCIDPTQKEVSEEVAKSAAEECAQGAAPV